MSAADIETAKRAVDDLISKLGHPDKMSKREYKEFLEEVSSDIEGRLEAVTQELESEGA